MWTIRRGNIRTREWFPSAVRVRKRISRRQHCSSSAISSSDIAEAALFLLGDGASYITGETLRIDGGFALPGVPEGWAQAYPVETGFVRNSYEKMMEREEKENV